ncbi:hypothetical protein ANO11243_023380 [Dothideomycetidae sp. 11243]|nr:hypothetical protein ANO11243_023380 [fungal sp. No.11243]
MTALNTAPVLSTPDEHVFNDASPVADSSAFPELSQDELHRVYEIDRTTDEILAGGWSVIALQFPDDMLRDAPRVFEALRDCLWTRLSSPNPHTSVEGVSRSLESTSINSPDARSKQSTRAFKLAILGDTSYGACCVDEIAAEHHSAEVVVHYGRTCLSPTARLPVIYVYTLKPLDIESAVQAFERTYPDRNAKIVLLADIPYQGHVNNIAKHIEAVGYSKVFAPSIVHDPSSLLPNRTIPSDVEINATDLKEYSLFHISDPPTSLLLNLGSRVSSIHIYATNGISNVSPRSVDTSTAQILRRRYALVAKLSTVPIFGILINTLSVKNYMSVLQQVKDLITAAGKKYYTVVVGKINPAKVANFAEIGGWVVIGCWESSLIESKDFWKPVITPFELKLALTDEKDRIWTGEWNSNFQAFLDDSTRVKETPSVDGDDAEDMGSEEDEPPVFDLRTGKYISQTRPMGRPRVSKTTPTPSETVSSAASSSLVKRAKGEVAQIGGEISPAAEFLRSQRTWQGLGSDHEIAYQHDEQGKVVGATMEEGRSGIAKGYAVGEDEKT